MIEKIKLKELVDRGLSTYKIAKEISCSPTNVRHYLKKYKLKTKSLSFWTKDRKCVCTICGETDQSKFYKRKKRKGFYTYCSNCLRKRQIENNRKNKLLSIEYKGGKCIRCGYKKCPAALAFHHRNPEEKNLDWKRMRNYADFEKLKVELDKCDLVCNNCHTEIHWILDGNKLDE